MALLHGSRESAFTERVSHVAPSVVCTPPGLLGPVMWLRYEVRPPQVPRHPVAPTTTSNAVTTLTDGSGRAFSRPR